MTYNTIFNGQKILLRVTLSYTFYKQYQHLNKNTLIYYVQKYNMHKQIDNLSDL